MISRIHPNQADNPEEVSKRIARRLSDNTTEKVHHNLKTKNLKV